VYSFGAVGEPASAAQGLTRDPVARLLVHHQWSRDHGTPRVTVLAGPIAAGLSRWRTWIRLTERATVTAATPERSLATWLRAAGADSVESSAAMPRPPALLLRPTTACPPSWIEAAATTSWRLATMAPRVPVAIAVAGAVLDGWLRHGQDRLRAHLRDGTIAIVRDDEHIWTSASRDPGAAARSLAELMLYEALEADASTRGRFELNGRLSVMVGSSAAEVDLLSRRGRIAVEVDGFHHFDDPDNYRRDRRKDLLLQGEGLLVVRVLASDVHHNPRAALAAIRQALACRLREGGDPSR